MSLLERWFGKKKEEKPITPPPAAGPSLPPPFARWGNTSPTPPVVDAASGGAQAPVPFGRWGNTSATPPSMVQPVTQPSLTAPGAPSMPGAPLIPGAQPLQPLQPLQPTAPRLATPAQQLANPSLLPDMSQELAPGPNQTLEQVAPQQPLGGIGQVGIKKDPTSSFAPPILDGYLQKVQDRKAEVADLRKQQKEDALLPSEPRVRQQEDPEGILQQAQGFLLRLGDKASAVIAPGGEYDKNPGLMRTSGNETLDTVADTIGFLMGMASGQGVSGGISATASNVKAVMSAVNSNPMIARAVESAARLGLLRGFSAYSQGKDDITALKEGGIGALAGAVVGPVSAVSGEAGKAFFEKYGNVQPGHLLNFLTMGNETGTYFGLLGVTDAIVAGKPLKEAVTSGLTGYGTGYVYAGFKVGTQAIKLKAQEVIYSRPYGDAVMRSKGYVPLEEAHGFNKGVKGTLYKMYMKAAFENTPGYSEMTPAQQKDWLQKAGYTGTWLKFDKEGSISEVVQMTSSGGAPQVEGVVSLQDAQSASQWSRGHAFQASLRALQKLPTWLSSADKAYQEWKQQGPAVQDVTPKPSDTGGPQSAPQSSPQSTPQSPAATPATANIPQPSPPVTTGATAANLPQQAPAPSVNTPAQLAGLTAAPGASQAPAAPGASQAPAAPAAVATPAPSVKPTPATSTAKPSPATVGDRIAWTSPDKTRSYEGNVFKSEGGLLHIKLDNGATLKIGAKAPYSVVGKVESGAGAEKQPEVIKLFHGSDKVFDAIRPGKAQAGEGVFLTDTAESAKEYGQNLYEIEVSPNKVANDDDWRDAFDELEEEHERKLRELEGSLDTEEMSPEEFEGTQRKIEALDKEWSIGETADAKQNAKVSARLREKGYDVLVTDMQSGDAGKEYLVLNPAVIKSTKRVGEGVAPSVAITPATPAQTPATAPATAPEAPGTKVGTTPTTKAETPEETNAKQFWSALTPEDRRGRLRESGLPEYDRIANQEWGGLEEGYRSTWTRYVQRIEDVVDAGRRWDAASPQARFNMIKRGWTEEGARKLASKKWDEIQGGYESGSVKVGLAHHVLGKYRGEAEKTGAEGTKVEKPEKTEEQINAQKKGPDAEASTRQTALEEYTSKLTRRMVKDRTKDDVKPSAEEQEKIREWNMKLGQELLDHIDSKDIERLSHRLNSGNPEARELFTALTGIEFQGSASKNMYEAIKQFAPSEFEAWDKRKGDETKAYKDEAERKEQAQRRRILLAKKVSYDGESRNFDDYITALLEDSYTDSREVKQGIIPVLRLYKTEGEGAGKFFHEFKTKDERVYVEERLTEWKKGKGESAPAKAPHEMNVKEYAKFLESNGGLAAEWAKEASEAELVIALEIEAMNAILSKAVTNKDYPGAAKKLAEYKELLEEGTVLKKLQLYAKDTQGIGANTMVQDSKDPTKLWIISESSYRSNRVYLASLDGQKNSMSFDGFYFEFGEGKVVKGRQAVSNAAKKVEEAPAETLADISDIIKAPYEMTELEYEENVPLRGAMFNGQTFAQIEEQHDYVGEMPDKAAAKKLQGLFKFAKQAVKKQREEDVREAIAKGNEVPASVLADYPGIKNVMDSEEAPRTEEPKGGTQSVQNDDQGVPQGASSEALQEAGAQQQAAGVDSAEERPSGGEVSGPKGSTSGTKPTQGGVSGTGTSSRPSQGQSDRPSESGVGGRDPGAKPSRQDRSNYRITEADALGKGGKVAKYEDNVKTIRLIRQIEEEGRLATDEERAVLVKYVGWGGIPEVFAPKPEGKWAERQAELKELFSKEEYESAKASTINAHYTAEPVIRTIYKMVENLGFNGGKILEPSMGTGNFFGLMPDQMLNNSKLFGVELDKMTGAIAKQLYRGADIRIAGFQEVKYPDNYFDLAISNVPFADFVPHDKQYAKLKASLHDYFFVKSIDKVRPGGLVVFITSTGTMDKQSETIRKHLASKAELVTAFRLPGDAFKENALTEVTTDLIVLRKLMPGENIENQPFITSDWVQTKDFKSGYTSPVRVNEFFSMLPDNVIGELGASTNMYGSPRVTVRSVEGRTFEKAVEELGLSNIYKAAEADAANPIETPQEIGEHLNEIKEGSYTIHNGKFVQKTDGILVPVELKTPKDKQRMGDMIRVKAALKTLLKEQVAGVDDSQLKELQKALSKVYDHFVKQHGYFNAPGPRNALRNDSEYILLEALENYNKDTKTATKAKIFTERTVVRSREIISAELPEEALALSLDRKGGVDISYVAKLLGTSEKEARDKLRGQVFKDPKTGRLVEKEAYLSGNVRAKLILAQEMADVESEFLENVEALEKMIPEDLPASKIGVRLGASWIEPVHIRSFIQEVFDVPKRVAEAVSLAYEPHTATWIVKADYRTGASQYTGVTSTWGTGRMNAIQILDKVMNGQQITIKDKDGDVEVLNVKATVAAREKARLMKDKFKDWVFENDERREALERVYNDRFNNIRLMIHDGSNMTFPGMSPLVTLMDHQKDAVARAVRGQKGTLFAHGVGAGKTYEMIATAMEWKRLGLANKPLLAVPNNKVGDFKNDFLKLYPAGNILVLDEKALDSKKRKATFARVAAGNYDAVIIPHSALKFIPMSYEAQIEFFREQLETLEEAILSAKAAEGGGKSDNAIVKALEKAKQKLQAKLQKLLDTPKDDLVTFEEMGIDALIVDEAHNFKNLFVYSKMRVPGITSGEAQKAADLYMKTHYLHKTGGRMVFATATPISNTMTEMFTMMRYLVPETMQEYGIEAFDSWASTFGEIVSNIEVGIDGTFRTKDRFSKFFNVSELSKLFRDFTDVKTSDMLNLPIPKIKDGQAETVISDRNELLADFVKDLGERAEILKRSGGRTEDDNFLLITSDGRAAATDIRLVAKILGEDPNDLDFEDSKVNKAVRNIIKIHKKNAKHKATQLVFLDMGMTADPGARYGFDLYGDIKKKLVQGGIPANEIAFMHQATTDVQKDALMEKVRKGEIRVLLGSTARMGEGVNVQDRLIALHHIDAPWKPSGIEQREGRMVRQGNMFYKLDIPVEIYRYVTDGSFDSYIWQMLARKAAFIGQMMRGGDDLRELEDVDEVALSYKEIAALSSGNPMIMKKYEVDSEVTRLMSLRSSYQSSRYELSGNVKSRKNSTIPRIEARISRLIKAKRIYDDKHKKDSLQDTLEIQGKRYEKAEEAGEALMAILEAASKEVKAGHTVDHVRREMSRKIGAFAGLDLHITPVIKSEAFTHGPYARLTLPNQDVSIYASHDGMGEQGLNTLVLSDSGSGNIRRIANAADKIAEKLKENEAELETQREELEKAEQELAKPFPQEKELAALRAEQAKVDAALGIGVTEADEEITGDEDFGPADPDGEAEAAATTSSTPPSMRNVQERLGKKVDETIGEISPSIGFSVKVKGGVSPNPQAQTRAQGPSANPLYESADPNIEARIRAAHGVTSPTFWERTKDFLDSVARRATRDFEWLPGGKEFAQLRFDLRNLQKGRDKAGDATLRLQQGITIAFKEDPKQFALFERKVLLDDLMEELTLSDGTTERKLPFGYTEDSLRDDYAEIEKVVANYPDVADALEKRKMAWDSVKAEYIAAQKAIGHNVDERFTRENYFRHQILEYANVRGLTGAGAKLKTPSGRGFLKQREGSSLDINTNYLEAEYEVMAQMLYDIEVAKIIKSVDRNHNVVSVLKAQAKAKNAQLPPDATAEDKVSWRSLVPDGYVIWQPKEGNVFYFADSIPAQLAEKLYAGALQQIGINADDITKVLVKGQRLREFVIKEEVAKTLDNLIRNRQIDPIRAFTRSLLGKWKKWQLTAPPRLIKYNLRNLTGDADAVFVGNPSTFKKVPKATNELYQVFFGDKSMSSNMRDWFERGGMQSTLQVQEMGDINRLKMFKDMLEAKGTAKEIPLKIIQDYWEKVRLGTDFREAILRYAAYLDFLEQMQASNNGKPKRFGGSIPEEVMALSDIKDRAFMLSNDLLGAYDSISVLGQELREYLLPFWSWKEVNAKRYYRFFKNAAYDRELASSVGRTAFTFVKRSPIIAAKVGAFVLKALALWALVQAWNSTRFPEEESLLPEDVRDKPHIIIGVDKNGKTLYLNGIGALADIMDWFALESPQALVRDYLKGSKNMLEVAKEIFFKAPVNTLFQALGPQYKTPAELIMGRKTYPDIWEPGIVRDNWQYIAQSVGLGDLYNYVKKFPRRPDAAQRMLTLVSDPGEASYYEALDAKRDYLKSIGKYSNFSSSGNEKSKALYNVKLAARYGDRDAFERFLYEYAKFGGTKDGLEDSLQNMDPLDGLNTAQKQDFINNWLDAEGKATLYRADQFYRSVVLKNAAEYFAEVMQQK